MFTCRGRLDYSSTTAEAQASKAVSTQGCCYSTWFCWYQPAAVLIRHAGSAAVDGRLCHNTNWSSSSSSTASWRAHEWLWRACQCQRSLRCHSRCGNSRGLSCSCSGGSSSCSSCRSGGPDAHAGTPAQLLPILWDATFSTCTDHTSTRSLSSGSSSAAQPPHSSSSSCGQGSRV